MFNNTVNGKKGHKHLLNKNIRYYQYISFIFILLMISVSSFAEVNISQPSHSTYRVIKQDSTETSEIIIDGDLTDTAWQSVKTPDSTLFYPWNEQQAPLTNFKATWDDNYFYFAFSAEDKEIVLVEQVIKEEDIGNEDRVELFFATGVIDQAISKNGTDFPLYYGIEIDALGRVLDFSATYYRKFNFDWDMLGLSTATKHDDKGYRVEGKIPLQRLKDLKLLKSNNELIAGVFRGEFIQDLNTIETRWMSWVHPKTEQPDFHVNKAFGKFLLVK